MVKVGGRRGVGAEGESITKGGNGQMAPAWRNSAFFRYYRGNTCANKQKLLVKKKLIIKST